jgi:hypothetical protein
MKPNLKIFLNLALCGGLLSGGRVQAQSEERPASAFLKEKGIQPTADTLAAAEGTGVGNGGLGEEKVVRSRIAEDLKIALYSKSGKGSAAERIRNWSLKLKFLVEEAQDDAKNALEKRSPAEAQRVLFSSLMGIQDSLENYPSISGAHTPRLIKRLVKLWQRLDERFMQLRMMQSPGPSPEMERDSLARYLVLNKILLLITDVEKNFDQKYIVPAMYKASDQNNVDASSEFLLRFQSEFSRVVSKEYEFILMALTSDQGDGQVRNEVPFNFFLNFTELVISDVIADLSSNIYGYSNGDALIRMQSLKDKLFAFNMKGDTGRWESRREAFDKVVEKLTEIKAYLVAASEKVKAIESEKP